MRATTAAVLLHLALLSPAFGAAPHLAFELILPAPHDLGHVESVAVTRAIGDTEKVDMFVSGFVDQINRSRMLRAADVTRISLMRRPQADVWLEVKQYTCALTERKGDIASHDADNKRVRRPVFWSDALCTARITVVDPATATRQSTFAVKGEGTSPRVTAIGDDERQIALEQATRYAAVNAAAMVTPRRVRETIALDDSAPAFDEGMALIDADRLPAARSLWEAALQKQPRSAALHYDLAAVCEALNDRDAANEHYVAARDLAPNEPRYAEGVKLFLRRGLR